MRQAWNYYCYLIWNLAFYIITLSMTQRYYITTQIFRTKQFWFCVFCRFLVLIIPSVYEKLLFFMRNMFHKGLCVLFFFMKRKSWRFPEKWPSSFEFIHWSRRFMFLSYMKLCVCVCMFPHPILWEHDTTKKNKTCCSSQSPLGKSW